MKKIFGLGVALAFFVGSAASVAAWEFISAQGAYTLCCSKQTPICLM